MGYIPGLGHCVVGAEGLTGGVAQLLAVLSVPKVSLSD